MRIKLGFGGEKSVTTGVLTSPQESIMKPTRALLAHRNYDADDYAYLAGKGWTNAEILARWSEEAARGNGPCRWESATARTKLAAVTGRS